MKFIENYENLYSVTEKGEVYSHKYGKFLTPIKQKNGYLMVCLYKDRKSKMCTIHRLVAKAFIPNRIGKQMVNHIDLNKQNNQISNLEWVTAKENMQHACDNGIRCGMRNGNSKLSNAQVIEIREKYQFRQYTYKMLSDEYGVIKNYIARIIKNQVWKSI